jgi:ribosomal protein S18 acetylase RimI-like enzyme
MNNVATMILDKNVATTTSSRAVTMRPATAEDMEAVWGMWKEIMDQKAYYPYDESLGHTREYILEEWVNLRNPIHVATMRIAGLPELWQNHNENGSNNNNDNEHANIPGVEIVVGAFILRANQPGYGSHVVNAAYMVTTQQRGEGIGSLLCKRSLQVAKQLGYRGMQFNLVVSTNTGAIKVWKMHGFQTIGTVPGGFYNSIKNEYTDAYIFYKSLLDEDE